MCENENNLRQLFNQNITIKTYIFSVNFLESIFHKNKKSKQM